MRKERKKYGNRKKVARRKRLIKLAQVLSVLVEWLGGIWHSPTCGPSSLNLLIMVMMMEVEVRIV